jgi:hypothetical protein
MSRDAWIADEPRISSVVLGVLSRARRRPLRVLAVTLIFTGVFVAARAQRSPRYLATLHFRISEGDLVDPSHGPVPPRSIREYILHVALSRGRVEQIMKRHHWSSAHLARNPVAAIDDFREDIEVEVSQNYFIYGRRAWDEPRSAHVSISLTGGDVEKTRAVLHDIGDTILMEQEARRTEYLSGARQMVSAQLWEARARAASLEERIGRLRAEVAGAGAGLLEDARARLATLQLQAAGSIEQMLALDRRSDELRLSADAERQKLGLVFELIDESMVALAPSLTALQLAGRGAVVLAIALALTALLVGSFDDRIYTADDLASHDLPAFGALPRFPGDDAGSHRARERTQAA